jgi:hypothetical protein
MFIAPIVVILLATAYFAIFYTLLRTEEALNNRAYAREELARESKKQNHFHK